MVEKFDGVVRLLQIFTDKHFRGQASLPLDAGYRNKLCTCKRFRSSRHDVAISYSVGGKKTPARGVCYVIQFVFRVTSSRQQDRKENKGS